DYGRDDRGGEHIRTGGEDHHDAPAAAHDLYDQDRQADSDGGHGRGDQQDGRNLADGGDRQVAVEGKVDRNKLEHDRHDGQYDKGLDPTVIRCMPGGRGGQRRRRGDRDQRDELLGGDLRGEPRAA